MWTPDCWSWPSSWMRSGSTPAAMIWNVVLPLFLASKKTNPVRAQQPQQLKHLEELKWLQLQRVCHQVQVYSETWTEVTAALLSAQHSAFPEETGPFHGLCRREGPSAQTDASKQ